MCLRMAAPITLFSMLLVYDTGKPAKGDRVFAGLRELSKSAWRSTKARNREASLLQPCPIASVRLSPLTSLMLPPFFRQVGAHSLDVVQIVRRCEHFGVRIQTFQR